MIKLKNGSEIHIIPANEPIRGSYIKSFTNRKFEIKSLPKLLLLFVKRILNKIRLLHSEKGG